jgi:hypothetical protein
MERRNFSCYAVASLIKFDNIKFDDIQFFDTLNNGGELLSQISNVGEGKAWATTRALAWRIHRWRARVYPHPSCTTPTT